MISALELLGMFIPFGGVGLTLRIIVTMGERNVAHQQRKGVSGSA